MGRFKKYGLAVLIFCISIPFFGQQPPWFVDSTDFSHTFVLNCIPTINGEEISDSDFIGVFQEVQGEKKCAGFTQWMPLSPSNNIESFQVNSTEDQLSSLNDYQFKIWRADLNCFIYNESIEVTYESDITTVDSIINDKYNSGYIVINAFDAKIPELPYNQISYCNNLGTAESLSNIEISRESLDYASLEPGLKIDSVTGTIYPARSTPGEYQIYVKSEECLANPTINLTILPAPEIDLGEDRRICEHERLRIDTSLDGQEASWSNDETTNEIYVKESGLYWVEVVDENGCVARDSIHVEIIPTPEINIRQEDFCDKVLLDLEHKPYRYEWSNGIQDAQTEITESSKVWVEAESEEGCRSTDTVSVEVRRLQIRELDYSTEPSSCWENGAIRIQQEILENADYPVTFSALNSITKQKIDQLDNIPEGVYTISVADARNCISQYEKQITVEQDCLNNYPVFSPNEDGNEDTYFIPHEGSIKIFDRAGKLLKELETPAYWDGTDLNGNKLPMGNYVMITDKGKPVNITIIR